MCTPISRCPSPSSCAASDSAKLLTAAMFTFLSVETRSQNTLLKTTVNKHEPGPCSHIPYKCCQRSHRPSGWSSQSSAATGPAARWWHPHQDHSDEEVCLDAHRAGMGLTCRTIHSSEAQKVLVAAQSALILLRSILSWDPSKFQKVLHQIHYL